MLPLVLWNHQTGMLQVCLAVSGGGEKTGNIHRNTCFYVADTTMLWRGIKSGRYMGWCTEKVFYILGRWRKKSIVCSEKQASSFDWKTKHQEANNILATNPSFSLWFLSLGFRIFSKLQGNVRNRESHNTKSKTQSHFSPRMNARVWDQLRPVFIRDV